jgi:hypothetical protein
MDFIPRHKQPFTLAEAIQLDPSLIADGRNIDGYATRVGFLILYMHLCVEIARLQNSLKHLRETQVALREHIRDAPEHDADVEDAAQENEETMCAAPKCVYKTRP